jgi:superfamily I DNA and/or RNA helicase
VVWKKTGRQVTVAVDDLPEEGIEAGALRLDRVANDVTYRRMRSALERLRGLDRGRPAQLRDLLLGEREPRLDPLRPLTPLDPRLNSPQAEAVRLALSAPDLALIHGPPGTGKTTAVVEVIRQCVVRRERVLAAGPSNIAADNLAEALVREGVEVVRIGHPARLLPAVVEHSLDAKVAEHPHTRVAQDLRRQVREALKRARREANPATRRQRWGELRALRREIAAVEEAAVRAVIDGAEVVLATCAGAQDPALAGREFDLAVIDEAAQALEPVTWIPLLSAGRVVLAGDHRQLPPTIISPEAARQGLGVTLFDRMMSRHGPRLSRILTIQYRMHRSIMTYPSQQLYEGKLEAAPAVAGHLLCGLPGVAPVPATEAPLWFIDTAGCGYEEETEAEGESKENPLEAEAAARHAEALLAAGVPPGAIGVITPYSAQVRRLRERLGGAGGDLEIDTVDGFQGREKEAIVLSLVRSNRRGEVGFLSDVRRLNVACTRARRHLAVLGDSATVARDPFIKGLIDYCEEIGAYRSAWELGLGDFSG